MQTIAIDLPAHGDSGGPPTAAEEVAERVHDLLADLGIVRPVVVGHSYGTAVASLYAARHACAGLVLVDSGPEIQPFAELIQRVAPLLRGPGFTDAWTMIENSLGLELIPEPEQTLVRDGHRVDQQVVLGYWEQMLSTPPAEFQSWIDTVLPRIEVPVLAVYGHPVSGGDQKRLDQWHDVTIEEHPGDGHFVHLVDPARFAASLRRFVDHCLATE